MTITISPDVQVQQISPRLWQVKRYDQVMSVRRARGRAVKEAQGYADEIAEWDAEDARRAALNNGAGI